MLGDCIPQQYNITINDARDELGRERMHVYSPVREARGEYDEWYKKYTNFKQNSSSSSSSSSPSSSASSLSCCSPETINFHYIEAEEMLFLHHVQYHPDHYRRFSAKQRHAAYPNAVGYSRKPSPPDGDKDGDATWQLLLEHINNDEHINNKVKHP
jgi:hypothetical protein